MKAMHQGHKQVISVDKQVRQTRFPVVPLELTLVSASMLEAFFGVAVNYLKGEVSSLCCLQPGLALY